MANTEKYIMGCFIMETQCKEILIIPFNGRVLPSFILFSEILHSNHNLLFLNVSYYVDGILR